MSSNYPTPPPQGHAEVADASGNPLLPAGLLQRSFHVATVAGIPIRLHALFPAFILIATVFGFLPPATMEQGVLHMLVFGPVLFLTVLLHELGHCAATKMVGGDVHGILLWPLGGLAFIGHSGDALDDLKVSIAGPLTHVPQSLAWLLLLAASNEGDVTLGVTGNFWADLCRYAIVINISLCVFNLFVPAYPLDGGRIFASILLLCGISVPTAAAVTAYVSIFLGLLIVALGVYLMQFLTIFVGGWVLVQANELYKLVQAGRADLHPTFAKYANSPQGGGGSGVDGGIAGALGGGRV